MRPPLEYGDNFPVPASQSWDPTVPWRFPRLEIPGRYNGGWRWVFPWITLGLGVSLGVLWMSWWLDLPLTKGIQGEQNSPKSVGEVNVVVPGRQIGVPSTEPQKEAPRSRPAKAGSRLT